MADQEPRPTKSRIEALIESGMITLIPAPDEVTAAQEFETITFSKEIQAHAADRVGEDYWVVLLDQGQKDVYGEFTVRHIGPADGIKYYDPEARTKRVSMSKEYDFTILQSERKRNLFVAFYNPSEEED